MRIIYVCLITLLLSMIIYTNVFAVKPSDPPEPSTVTIDNTSDNPVPVTFTEGKTTQLLDSTYFILPERAQWLTIQSGIDVSSCSSLRLRVGRDESTLDPPDCQLLDELINIGMGTIEVANGRTLLIETPSAGTISFICDNRSNGFPINISAALYCR